MAKGFSSIHPLMEASLRELGVTNEQVTQGYGNAPASSGYHSIESYIEGRPYSSCVDLTWGLSTTAGIKDHLIAGGFCPFFRYTGSFASNRHIHAVYVGARDDNGKVKILSGPRMQIIDYTQGKDGLYNHASLTGKWAPSDLQKKHILDQYSGWVPDRGTRILAPNGDQILCYAFLEGDTVRCEARPLLEYWGITVGYDGHLIATYKGNRLDLSQAALKVEGDFTRGNVRGLMLPMEIGTEFSWNYDGSATVQLKYNA